MRDAVKVTIPKDERSSVDHGDDAVMFGVAHGLRARDHAMAPGIRAFSKIRAKDRDTISSATMCELGYAERAARARLGLD